ncbi:MAG: Hpt domain-containing protein [Flavobacteriales bacterium]|nr:Hpt domain-containing protein [Flavobacteriales bacterium]
MLAPPAAVAQSAQARRDSLKKVVGDLRLRMDAADSTGDVRDAIDARLSLASVVKPNEALDLLEDAAAGAQSADLLELEVVVRKRLAEALAKSGKHARAFEEAMHVTALDEVRLAEQYLFLEARTDSALTRTTEQRDSLINNWQEELQEARHRESHMEATAERWMFIALGLALALMLMLLIVLVRGSRQNKRTRKEIEALRAEIVAMKEAPKNRMREPAVVRVTETPVAVDAVAEAEPIGADTSVMDATLLALFRKRAPERLATLRDARARGDQEKVARVVHTLKPQLVALDENGLGALCIRITVGDASRDPKELNTDLDLLERSIEQLLS